MRGSWGRCLAASCCGCGCGCSCSCGCCCGKNQEPRGGLCLGTYGFRNLLALKNCHVMQLISTFGTLPLAWIARSCYDSLQQVISAEASQQSSGPCQEVGWQPIAFILALKPFIPRRSSVGMAFERYCPSSLQQRAISY